MHILELEKVGKHLSKLETKLESWAYFFREVHNLTEDTLQELRSKNPMIEKAIEELEYLSQDEKTRQLYEEQLKAEFDYNSGILPHSGMERQRANRKEFWREDWKVSR